MRRVSKKQEERNKEKASETEKLHQLFKSIWDEREDESGCCYCFETGAPMHGSIYRSNSACYDHILEKSRYSQYKFTKKNIVIVLPNIHQQKGRNIDKTPKMKEYREELLNLHQQGKLNDEKGNGEVTEKRVLE